MARKVVVQGGGKNLYRIGQSGRTFYVSKVNSGFLSSSSREIGRATSLEDALSIIRSHSGREIKSISGW